MTQNVVQNKILVKNCVKKITKKKRFLEEKKNRKNFSLCSKKNYFLTMVDKSVNNFTNEVDDDTMSSVYNAWRKNYS